MFELDLDCKNTLISGGTFVGDSLEKDDKADFVHLEIPLDGWESNSLDDYNYLVCHLEGRGELDFYFQNPDGTHFHVTNMKHTGDRIKIKAIGLYERSDIISLTIIAKSNIRVKRIFFNEWNPLEVSFLFPVKVDGQSEENLRNYLRQLEIDFPVTPKFIGEFDFRNRMEKNFLFYQHFQDNEKELNITNAFEKLREATRTPYKIFLNPSYRFDSNSIKLALQRLMKYDDDFCPVHNGTYYDKVINEHFTKTEKEEKKLDMISGLAFKDDSEIISKYDKSLAFFRPAEKIHYRV